MFIVLCVSLAVCGCLLAFLAYCFYLLSLKVSLTQTDDQLCGTDNGITPDYCDSSKSDTYLYCAFAVAALLAGYIVAVVLFKRRFSVAVQLVKLACEPLHSLKHIYWFPTLQLLIGFASIAVVTTVLLWTMSTATVQKVSTDTIPGGVSKQLVYTEREKYLLVLVVLVTSWWLSFLIALGESILAGAVAVWYFSREKSTLYSPLWTSLKLTMRYHLGSVVRGSLISLFLRYPRAVIGFFRNLVRSKPRACGSRCVNACCLSCFCCYEAVLKYYTDFTFIFIAIFGDAYAPASRRSFFLILRNNRRISVPSQAGWFVTAVVKLTVTLTGTLFVFGWLMNQQATINGEDTDTLVSPIGPVVLAFLISAFVSQVFGGNVQACLDAVLLCGVCDEEMFIRDQRFMEDRLIAFLDDICEEQTEQQKEDREAFIVQNPLASERKTAKSDFTDLPTADRYREPTPRDAFFEQPDIILSSGRLNSGTQRANMYYGVNKLAAVDEEPDDSRPMFSR
jgi:solute carrier family 44 protein 1 (choline transporter-like protein)